jgi:hypothetical protein
LLQLVGLLDAHFPAAFLMHSSLVFYRFVSPSHIDLSLSLSWLSICIAGFNVWSLHYFRSLRIFFWPVSAKIAREGSSPFLLAHHRPWHILCTILQTVL